MDGVILNYCIEDSVAFHVIQVYPIAVYDTKNQRQFKAKTNVEKAVEAGLRVNFKVDKE